MKLGPKFHHEEDSVSNGDCNQATLSNRMSCVGHSYSLTYSYRDELFVCFNHSCGCCVNDEIALVVLYISFHPCWSCCSTVHVHTTQTI